MPSHLTTEISQFACVCPTNMIFEYEFVNFSVNSFQNNSRAMTLRAKLSRTRKHFIFKTASRNNM